MPGTAAFTVDFYIREENADLDPPQYTYFLGKRARYTEQERHISDTLVLAMADIWRSFATASRDFLLLHAGAVALDGGVVLMPAAPDNGKSSLALSLVLSGAGFLSDEFGALDPVTGRAYAVPRPLAFDPDFLENFPDLEGRLADKEMPIPLGKRFVRPEDVDAHVLGPTPIRWIVFPTNSFGGRPRLTPIPKAQAVEQMVRYSFNIAYYGERGVILLSRIAEEAEAFLLEGGSREERADLVMNTLQ
jgi:hypothetical protein